MSIMPFKANIRTTEWDKVKKELRVEKKPSCILTRLQPLLQGSLGVLQVFSWRCGSKVRGCGKSSSLLIFSTSKRITYDFYFRACFTDQIKGSITFLYYLRVVTTSEYVYVDLGGLVCSRSRMEC